MLKRNIYCLLVVVCASCALISINYYTIKILSGVRAYINGESEYSKGQKDALLYLYSYIETQDTAYRASFDLAIGIPMADNLARKNLLADGRDEITGNYFTIAHNHADDIPEMIWLFKMFKYSYMKTPIRLWIEAEPLINKLYDIGNHVDKKIKQGSLTKEDKLQAVTEISFISTELYQKESAFSKVLGDTARRINSLLLLLNIICIFCIVGTIVVYSRLMIRRLRASNKVLEAKNGEVLEANHELDTLIYSVSHDLRAPITSIKGLINILREEDHPEMIKEYTDLLEDTVDKQDQFITEIIDFYKSRGASVTQHEFSLRSLIRDVVNNHRFTPLAVGINITEEIGLDKVYSDELRLKMIINNLVSNAIKYSDQRKDKRMIVIRTEQMRNEIVIEVVDNGVGIHKKNIKNIYNLFFMGAGKSNSTGVGLYILKQNVNKLKGRVDVRSELNVGTTFTVYVPFKYKRAPVLA